jgi:hypothetical protein
MFFWSEELGSTTRSRRIVDDYVLIIVLFNDAVPTANIKGNHKEAQSG